MHDSVANATPRAHESARVNDLLPEQLRGSSQNLVNFLKEYYDYLNQDGLPSKELRHIVVENDIDETSAKYLDSIQDEIASIVPNSDYMDRVTLYKRIVHYYRSKGTIESVYTFFRIFFNDVDDLQIEYGDRPYTYRIRTSKLPAGGQEWRSKFRKLAHPAGLKFNVATLVEAGVVGGGDLSKVRAGWDPDYWFDGDSQNEDYWAEHDKWHYDLLPPNRRKEIETFAEPILRYALDKESSISGASGFVVEEVTNTIEGQNGYISPSQGPTWNSTEEAFEFDGVDDRIYANTDFRMDGLDPSNEGDLSWDYFTDSEGNRVGLYQFDEEDAFTISLWLKTSQTADSILVSSRDANGVGLGKIDEKFAVIYIQEGGDSDASDGIPVILSSTTSIADGQWHHLAYVYDGNRSGSLWVDGVKEATDTSINLESFLDDGVSRQHTFHLSQIMGGYVPNESQGNEGTVHTSGYLRDFRVYTSNLTDLNARFLYGSGANSTANPYQALDLDPFTAYFLSKYEPPVDVLVKTLVNAQAGLRWRSGAIDRISGDDYAANIYGDDSDGEIYGDPPAEIIESRVLDIMFVMSPFLEDARDSFVHTQYQAQDKFFDPGESIGSYAKLDFNELEKEFDFSVNRSPFSVFGADVDVIPHTLKFLEGVNDSDDANINDRASEDGDGLRIQLNSATSAGNNFKFNINLENEDNLDDADYTLYDDSDNYNDSQGDAFLIVRPERYQDYNQEILNNGYYAAGTSTTAYLKVYQANTASQTVGVPLTITASPSATAIDTTVQGVWGWGTINSDGSILDINIVDQGAGFTTTHTIADVEDNVTDKTTPDPHYLIKVGMEWSESSTYVVGDHLYNGDELYEVTVAGTTGSTAPTHTSGSAVDGGVTFLHIGKVAKAVVQTFDESTNTTVGKGGIGSWGWITKGSGYKTLAPSHSDGFDYDQSRWRLGTRAQNNEDHLHNVRWTSYIQNTAGSNADINTSDGPGYRPWFIDGLQDLTSYPLEWHYQNTQLTNGNTSTIRLDIVDDGSSEGTGTLRVRSLDYRTLTDSIFIEE